ncbi:hypothetical protein KIH41_05400 [Litoribacter ruber]|uniref:hypothetical protein n=1 Tax=Litoribacter ruber TaxID=702568 RepID=UPI001BD9D41B|nr:hypothetical protein [Litoribacter ruber]MBT0810711.1 hypothetical protein [Litoribacter ruber]
MKSLYPLSLLLALFIFSACETDDDPVPEQFEVSYDMVPVDDSGVSGTVTINNDLIRDIYITVQLQGTEAGRSYPLSINNASEHLDWPDVIELNPIDGEGRSETNVTQINGLQTSIEEWLSLDGLVLVHESQDSLQNHLSIGYLGSTDPNVPGGL